MHQGERGTVAQQTQIAGEWITRPEFAQCARVSVATLRRWSRLGIGPRAHRVGPRLVRYRKAEVDAWMKDADRS
ncbi:helix-turn-helix transcriptional regulator [Actinomadura flavalba]|uniref:helix-turn-helix transcriptional regulator n=1 Tax=Actinomadura flavalba TaxID=1120938 RepID=UPI0009DC0AE0|nr:helix-turn-helix domain-containing protein [Actinomadura flavalba]